MNNNRPTIGFLLCLLDNTSYQAMLWPNVKKAAVKHDVNLIFFVGKSPGSPYGNDANHHIVYELCNEKNLDALIIVSSTFNTFLDIKRQNKYYNKKKPLQIISIGEKIENIPSILVNNKIGMSEAVNHLIVKHGYKKIAFIKGKEGHSEADDRFEAYKETLKKYKIKYNPELIFQGNFVMESGERAVEYFVKNNIVNFEAIVAANDEMALGAYKKLKDYGYRIPTDKAIVGFDDVDLAKCINPPITTVRQPFEKITEYSVKMALNLINGKKVPDIVEFPTKLVVRQSCGCLSKSIVYSNLSIKSKSKINNNSFIFNKKSIIDNIKNNMIEENIKFDIYKKWIDEIFENIILNINDDNYEKKLINFISELIFIEKIKENDDYYFHKILNIININIISFIKDKSNIKKINNFFKNCHIMLGEVLLRPNAYNSIKERYQLWLTREISQKLLSSFDINELMNTIYNEIPKLEISSCYISLYLGKVKRIDTLDWIIPEYSEMVLAYTDYKRKVIRKRKKFKTLRLIPDSLINNKKRYTHLIMPIFFKNEHYGLIIYEIGKQTGTIFETLRGQISTALKGAILLKEQKTTSRNLRNAKDELEKVNNKLIKLAKIKNDFITNITHDFRSPLTVILSISDLGLKVSKQEEENENYKIIYDASLRLKNSIDRLLELERIDEKGIRLKVREVNIIHLINSILNFYSSSVIGSGITIIKKIPDKNIKNFYTDTEKFEEIFNNIMSNAIKFVDSKKGEIIITLTESKNNIIISVKDNGMGIPKNKLKVIFNRFEQTENGRNNPYRGTGIGLAFAKQLMVYLHGKIWAESDGVGKGAVFFLEFKKGKSFFNKKDFSYQVEKNNESAKKIIRSEVKNILQKNEVVTFFHNLNKTDEFDIKKAKILIVDDDINIRNIVMRYLEISGFQNYILASDGKKALDSVYEYNPDIIICDYNMPNMKGDDFHDNLLGNPNYKKTPFIFLSAIADNRIIIERRKKGASAYLKKPIEENDLILTVEQHLKKYFEYLKTLKLSTVDELTGLFNKEYILNRMHQELSVRMYRDLSIIVFDIDELKDINNKYGYTIGDEIIRKIGNLIISSFRMYDIRGKYGNDEFVVILPDAKLKQSMTAAKQLLKKIKQINIQYEGKKITFSVSFGIISLSENEEYICKQLKIKDLKEIYNIKNPENINWDNINKYKYKLLKILLKCIDDILSETKIIQCKKCGYNFNKSSFQLNNFKCLKCESEKLIYRKNQAYIFYNGNIKTLS